MSSRTSARQASASSPPRNQAATRTRNLRGRSQSADLDASSNVRGAKRGARQGSTESINDKVIAVNAKGKGKGKAVKPTDLSALQEEEESGDPPDSDDSQDLDLGDLEGFTDDSSQGRSPDARPKAKDNVAKLAKMMFPDQASKTVASSSRSAQPTSSRNPAKASSSRNNEGDAGDPPGTSTEDVALRWQQHTKDNNKENTKPVQTGPAVKRGTQNKAATNKRGFVPDEEDSQDDGFESDTRVPNPARNTRQAAVPRPAKRTRVENDSEPSSEQPRQRTEQEESDSEGGSEAPPSPPVATQVKVAAKMNIERSTMPDRRVQIRTPWSPNDEALLIRYIGEHGCRWSYISRLDGWEKTRNNFDVQLKDKARNIKASYLKARQPIPLNFSQVRLGKKEIDAVRRVDPEYNQDEEEEEE